MIKIGIQTEYGIRAAEMDPAVQLSKNFRLSELSNTSGDPEEIMYLFSSKTDKHEQALQIMRDQIRRPINVNSGYRQSEYNKQIGGDSNSAHLLGLATDIKLISGLVVVDVVNAWFGALQAAGINQGAINIYKGYYHLESYSMDLFRYWDPYTIRVYESDDRYEALKKYYEYNGYNIMRVRK